MKKILLSLLIAIGLGVSNNNKVEIPACSIVETKRGKARKSYGKYSEQKR